MHIFSEGKEADFVDMRTLAGGVRPFFHLNYDLMSSFHHMVSADGFVFAHSMMSWAVGMLREKNNFLYCINPDPDDPKRRSGSASFESLPQLAVEEEREFMDSQGAMVSLTMASAQRAEEEAWEEVHFGGPE